MTALATPQSDFAHAQTEDLRLYVSRCLSCGLIVAASPLPENLLPVERVHSCPVYLNYSEPEA